MKIETQPLENHQVKLIVEVEPEQLEKARQKAARELAKRVKVPGFRPGKAPFAVIVRQVGEPAILEQAIDDLVQEVYPEAVKESGINPYGPGSLTNIPSTEPPIFEFEIPLAAEVVLGDYNAVRKPYEYADVTDSEVENFLTELRSRQATLEPTEQPVDYGDMVTVRLSADRMQVEGDADPSLINERSMPIFVHPAEEASEEANSGEWPFPGFSHLMIGLNPEDEKTIEHVFSDESPYESLRGVSAQFKIKVEEIKKRILPEADDAFAATVGEFPNVQALRDEIRHSLKHQKYDQYHQEYDEQILDEIISQATISFPPQMVENEIDGIIENFTSRLKQDQMDIDLYLKSRKIEMKGLREEAREIAEKRIKRSLVIGEISQAEKIEPTPEELQQQTIQALAQAYPNLSKKEAKRLNDQNVMSNVMSSVYVSLVNDKTLERIREIASDGAYQGFVHDDHETDEAALLETPEAEIESEIPANDDTDEPQPAEPVQDETVEETVTSDPDLETGSEE